MLVILLQACEREPSEREQAQAFLARLTDLEADADPEARHAQLLALQGLRLTHDPIRQARDRCVSAHTGLMLAEAAQATARAQLLRAANRDAGAPLPATVTTEVEQTLAQAAARLTDAKRDFEQCRQQTRALTVRYR